MISYAQNFEDVLLARAFRGRDHGFYIDVGAWHSIVDSVTKHFYDLGWNGINVEPARECFSLLERERPRDVNLQVAVGDRRETRRFYEFVGSGLSTFSAEYLGEYASLGLLPQESDIEVIPLREICDRHAHGEIDFLKIDVEGWERQVILGGDWMRYRPRIVLVEAVLPNPGTFLEAEPAPGLPEPAWEAWEEILCSQDYEFCYFDGLNRFYVRREDRDLREAFRSPPNVFDGFEVYPTARIRAEVLDLQTRYATLGRERDDLTRELGRLETLSADLRQERDDFAHREEEAKATLEVLMEELRCEQSANLTLQAQRDGLATEKQDLEERLRAFLHSRSWRYTGPLRAAVRRARSVLGWLRKT